MAERTPYERETLIFNNPEAAQQFREKIEGRLVREQKPNIQRGREVVAEEVATEFEKHQEPAATISQPWEHSAQEHEEVQQLVNIAFTKDLPAALAQARRSEHYPRNLDLLHDVLTGEMYQLLQQHKLNQQPITGWIIVIATIILVALIASIVLFVI